MKKQNPALSLLREFSVGIRRYFLAAVAASGLSILFSFLTPQIIRFTVDSVIGVEAMDLPAPALSLIAATRQSFFEGIRYARQGYRVSDISAGVQNYAESKGYGVVRDYVGHGVGAKMHEDPEVPNYVQHGRGSPRLIRGMTIAVEPMINAGGWEVKVLPDGWTVVTADGSLSAHYENSILITDGEPEILTMADDI